jgi:hypothetical protein
MYLCRKRGIRLLLDLVLPSEHIINMGKVVCAGEEAIGAAFRGVALLEVGSLTEVAHLIRREFVSHVL